MELLNGGTLTERIESHKFSEEEAATVMRGILSAVAYLHQKEIIHRDLKPDNIMFENESLESVKIIDFGLSAKYQGSTLQGNVGTALYMAPE
jgi:calcium-dependent protein kinase